MPIAKDEFEEAKPPVHDFLVEKAKEFYEKQNYAVYTGKKIGRFVADVISIRDQTLTIAIEAKPNNATEIRKGVGQANSYLDWVHEVFLMVPPEGIDLCKQVLRYSPIGILTVMNDKITVVKDAERNEPDPLKLSRLLSNTVGFCWICGRTFNVVKPSQERNDSIYIAHKDLEPKLFKALEKIKGKKIRTKGSWVSICTVCSRILGDAIAEYLRRAFEKVEFPSFDFDEYRIKEIGDLLRKKIATSREPSQEE